MIVSVRLRRLQRTGDKSTSVQSSLSNRKAQQFRFETIIVFHVSDVASVFVGFVCSYSLPAVTVV